MKWRRGVLQHELLNETFKGSDLMCAITTALAESDAVYVGHGGMQAVKCLSEMRCLVPKTGVPP